MKVLKEVKGMKAAGAVALAAAAGGLASGQKGRRNTSRNGHLGLVFLRPFCPLAPGLAGQPDRRRSGLLHGLHYLHSFTFPAGTGRMWLDFWDVRGLVVST
jgi:hypothetical protein